MLALLLTVDISEYKLRYGSQGNRHAEGKDR